MLTRCLQDLLPHSGRMRLISAVVRWDEAGIECRADSHRDPDNPLRVDASLPSIAGLEYGAQAMAIHGALVAGRMVPPRVGLLVAAHDLAWTVDRLDTIADALTIRATRILGSANQVVYEFSLLEGARLLVSGRASVFLAVD